MFAKKRRSRSLDIWRAEGVNMTWGFHSTLMPILMLMLHWNLSFVLGQFHIILDGKPLRLLVYFNILSFRGKSGNEIKELDELQKEPIWVVDMNHSIVRQEDSVSNQRTPKSIVFAWQRFQILIKVY